MKPRKIFIITETSYSHNDFEGIGTLYRFYNKEIRDEYFKTLLSEKENEGYEIKIDNDNLKTFESFLDKMLEQIYSIKHIKEKLQNLVHFGDIYPKFDFEIGKLEEPIKLDDSLD